MSYIILELGLAATSTKQFCCIYRDGFDSFDVARFRRRSFWRCKPPQLNVKQRWSFGKVDAMICDEHRLNLLKMFKRISAYHRHASLITINF